MDERSLIRFTAKTRIQPDGCIIWTGSQNNVGYGQFHLDRKTVLAHRVAYEHWIGEIPVDHELDHLCRVPACVAPTHLEPVTHAENCARGLGYQRPDPMLCGNGLHPWVTDNLVWTGSNWTCRECARETKRRWKKRA